MPTVAANTLHNGDVTHRFFVIALLNEGSPDGSGSNGITPDASGYEVGSQSFSECCHSALHIHVPPWYS